MKDVVGIFIIAYRRFHLRWVTWRKSATLPEMWIHGFKIVDEI